MSKSAGLHKWGLPCTWMQSLPWALCYFRSPARWDCLDHRNKRACLVLRWSSRLSLHSVPIVATSKTTQIPKARTHMRRAKEEAKYWTCKERAFVPRIQLVAHSSCRTSCAISGYVIMQSWNTKTSLTVSIIISNLRTVEGGRDECWRWWTGQHRRRGAGSRTTVAQVNHRILTRQTYWDKKHLLSEQHAANPKKCNGHKRKSNVNQQHLRQEQINCRSCNRSVMWLSTCMWAKASLR